jgi:predicted nucleic acid-binding protein
VIGVGQLPNGKIERPPLSVITPACTPITAWAKLMSPGIDVLETCPAVTVAELRYGAIVAEWGAPRRTRIETAIAEATVVPVTDAPITAVAELRAASVRSAPGRLGEWRIPSP